MLSFYDRYFIKRTGFLFCVITILLAAAVWIIQSFRLLELVSKNGITIGEFFKLGTYVLPALLYVLLPISTCMSLAIELSRAKKHQEIITLQNAGCSHLQIAKPFIIIAVIATLLNFLISLYLLPTSYKEFQALKRELSTNYVSIFPASGEFLTKISGITIYIEKKDENNNMRGVMIHTTQNGYETTVSAQMCKLSYLNDQLQLIVTNGTKQDYSRKSGKLILTTFDQYIFHLNVFSQIDQKAFNAIPYHSKFLHELFNHVDKLEVNKRFIAHGHSRIIWPFFCISFSLLPIALVIRSFDYRRATKKRAIIIILIIFSVAIIAFVLENLASKHTQLIPLMYLNGLLIIGCGIELLRRRSWIASQIGYY